MLTKIKNFLVAILVIGMIARGTNPNYVQHRSKTWPGREKVSFPIYSVADWGKDRDQTNYHNYGYFSLTTNRNNGSRTSIGLFRMVFDLRTQAQTEKEREQADQADAVEISRIEAAHKLDLYPFKFPHLQKMDSTR